MRSLLPLMVCVASVSATATPVQTPDRLDCGYRPPEHWAAELRAAVARGEIEDPANRPFVPPPRTRGEGESLALGVGGGGCLTPEQFFLFEDTNGLLLTPFSDGELLDMMTTAANALVAQYGDVYDYIGYWVNFDPDHLIGAAFYLPIFNEILGIGSGPFDERANMGLSSTVIDGFVMMWNVNTSYWEAGDGPGADFTRLALGQEFEHRWALFLPPLLDGRSLQGGMGCGRMAHWNWKVDGQGSSMEISEWVGANPAVLQGSFVTFNTDIPGSVYSYTDLYLMGYVSPAEMDAGNSELRYMETSDCSSDYSGTVSTFDSSDIIAAAGARVPDSSGSQRDYKTAWIFIHQPGAPPTDAEYAKAIGILEQHQADWATSTLGLGTMDDRLFDDCNCNGVPDADDLAQGTSTDANSNAIPDECEDLGTPFCLGVGCPCGNDDPAAGCVNSTGSGAGLVAVGSTSVAADDMLLVASGCPPGNSGLYFMGTSTFPPVFVADGLGCTGGLFRYFPSVVDGAGTFVLANPVASAPPGTIVPGDTRHYQAWTRDVLCGPPPAPCLSPCVQGSNLSRGLTVTFSP